MTQSLVRHNAKTIRTQWDSRHIPWVQLRYEKIAHACILIGALATFGVSALAEPANAYLEFVRQQADARIAAHPAVSGMDEWTARRSGIRAALTRAW
ncbi:MAG: hypothetical protein K1Y02_18660, partial [Candidatus Hydrogenedentes bacterium]|nr:hypothetical protein [Candidatus Hydrogenedentota bacterium]